MSAIPFEVNFDGLVGPTHNYAGLSWGNIASTSNASLTSNPREAARQGLNKMRQLHELGLPQAVLPPQFRPHLPTLRGLGFDGTDEEVIVRAAKSAPRLLAACSSASAMWAANAATVAPSADTADGRVHFTPANLVAKFHRAIEPETTFRVLSAIFADERRFRVHRPLPGHEWLGDEGAANHTRLFRPGGAKGLHFFVYGRTATQPGSEPKRFPARQTREASEAVVRRHRLAEAGVVLAQQAPGMIDSGIFHNDVISVGNGDFLFFHEGAFVEESRVIDELQRKFAALTGGELKCQEVGERDVSTTDAVKSYLFNSQLVSLPQGGMALIAPLECERSESVKGYLANLASARQTPITDVRFLDLRQSMNNGGGPACLRLRIPLTAAEWAACNQGIVFTEALYQRLGVWIEKHYRDRLKPDDVADPGLVREGKEALDELTGILKLGSVYEFQRGLTTI